MRDVGQQEEGEEHHTQDGVEPESVGSNQRLPSGSNTASEVTNVEQQEEQRDIQVIAEAVTVVTSIHAVCQGSDGREESDGDGEGEPHSECLVSD